MCIYIYIYIYIYHTGDGGGRVKREGAVENEELRRQMASTEAAAGKLRQMLAAREHAPPLAEVCQMARDGQWEDSAGWGWGAAHTCSG